MRQKNVNAMTNSEGADQTAPQEQSDLGLHCLLRPICPRFKMFYNNHLLAHGEWPLYDIVPPHL